MLLLLLLLLLLLRLLLLLTAWLLPGGHITLRSRRRAHAGQRLISVDHFEAVRDAPVCFPGRHPLVLL